ncbi:uncharacterized protein LOC141692909 [Apium graveolens]|uniref:uncharacterized protein LOC141692909 n=1 Tax=Apium graveolens TaxID=4045 RepID=UPI003D795DE8
MASKRRRNQTPLPWIAAIEALASHETPTSLLTDLVNKIPGEFRKNEGKNAKELVCLRILESLSLLNKGNSTRKPDSSARISPSDSCENVLRQLQLKSSSANQESVRDVEAFVRDKRACLPKSGLEQLKDVILKESDLIPFHAMKMSGLLNKNHSDGNATRPEGSGSDAIKNPPAGDLSSGKKVMSDSATANKERSSPCLKRKQDAFCAQKAVEGKDSDSSRGRRSIDDVPGAVFQHSGRAESDIPRDIRVENLRETLKNVDYVRVASKKLKMSSTVGDAEFSTCNQKAVAGKDLDSSNERMNVDNVPEAVFQHSGRIELDLFREIRVENLRETITSENVDYDHVASKKLKMSSTVGNAELLHNQLQGTCNVEKMTQGTSGKERNLNIRSEEAKKDCEGFVELKTRCSSALFVHQGTNSIGAKEKSEHSLLLNPDSVRGGEVKATVKDDYQPESLSDDEHDEILIRNNAFLNSQHSHSEDSLATLNGTKKLCMVCKIGGQLLVCASGSCQRVVHKKCMDVAATFDAATSFYCPYCAYSQAISEYLECKKKYSLARRALVTFINQEKPQVRKLSNISRREDLNHLKESEICNKCVEQSRPENVVSRASENSSRKNMRNKPSVSCDSSSSERTRDVTCGANEVALEDKRNAERGSSVCFQSPSEPELQVPVLLAQNTEAESSLPGGSEQLASVDKLQQVSHQPKRSKMKSKDMKIAHGSKSKDMKIAHGCKQHAGTEKEQDVSNQQPVLPCEPEKPTHSGVGRSSGEKKELITDPSLRVQKGEPQYTYPSLRLLKRKKIPWSIPEEEALTAGVKRFASNHDKQVPWKMILEFGGAVFVNRTAVDLKDKWRNMCKGSSKVRKNRVGI